MKRVGYLKKVLSCTACAFVVILSSSYTTFSEKLRVIVETDMGGDTDDNASMTRFLLHACDFEVEGLIANNANVKITSFYRDSPVKPAGTSLGILKQHIDAYDKVYSNLKSHRNDYPSPSYLRGIAVSGLGNDGRDLIIRAVDESDTRPVWYMDWGISASGSVNSLKKALEHVKATRSAQQYQAFAQKICTSANGTLTLKDLGCDIQLNVWSMSRTVIYVWGPESAKYIDSKTDVRENHGPMGYLYGESWEGDSPTFLYLAPQGNTKPYDPASGSWMGTFKKDGCEWVSANTDNIVKSAKTIQDIFKTRMDWCVSGGATAAHSEHHFSIAGSRIDGRQERNAQMNITGFGPRSSNSAHATPIFDLRGRYIPTAPAAELPGLFGTYR
jgi:hypothetical protein